jgi:hypothetical protein
MGKNNRARRAAKAKAKAHSHGFRGSAHARDQRFHRGDRSDTRASTDGARAPFDGEAARQLLLLAAEALRDGDPVAHECLDVLRVAPVAVVDRAAEALVLALVASLWAAGWQPAELQRQGRIGCASSAATRLVSRAMATDHAGRRSVTLHARWIAQVEALGLPRVDGRPGWIARWSHDERLDRSTAVAAMADVIANLRYLPRLDPILPPPGSGDAPGAPGAFGSYGPAGADNDPVLERIRNLLAKAESTTFEAEAMAFTAKAQELMTRHAIDAALVQGHTRADDRPVAIRIPIDAPYVNAKTMLLQIVAAAGRCRAVFQPSVSLSTVVGFPADLAAVEMLFTSLLVQAQTAMADTARRAPAGSRPRSQSFRSAFLAAYTNRIGVRLDEINAAVYADVEAERGSAFLPVLRSRSAAVDDFVTDRFGTLTSSPVRRGYDAAGWASGTVAADNARLGSGEVGPRT